MLHNIKLLIAYDGTAYLGWQSNNTGRSIEERLKKALEHILQQTIILQAASRTDVGVHADGQVVNFFTTKELNFASFALSVNSQLPKDIVVLKASLASPHFHPTLDAVEKEYRYQLCYSRVQRPHMRLYAWHYHHPLNIEIMREAANFFIGTHNFSALCNERKSNPYDSKIRHLSSINIQELPEKNICYRITGPNFLYKMVRNLVGTLVYIGAGKIGLEASAQILASTKRQKAGITAPAHGLSLYHINYEKP